ncbi:hypothetical protein FBZ98_104637 [Rhizobium sp. ERR 922]|uniref:Uncharacterized protein n=1 Tax=Rhizobium dioscoreae TaxID=2653122 RepID=A0ABQ0Z7S3_9HYPH|nr:MULTISPECIES: hypothetical protein [Rhizobium]TWB53709.1 hypothetical protein FBZ98_104637 [Rhizobium sp. ERR 922]TWB95327.1 hypothetical protein FBZ97_10414 [Rhizobium sp. ERR 942]GES41264.1 hypothetical protein RsS62_05160 [Rhizobium dioscoreae]GES51381.1 hypothetical protein RsS93_39950 [Rhizobium dioscoreae]GLU82833.1 hypothetical protein Rhsp01_40090 [Rhizobium sp. NBRC 114257]
MAGVVLIGIKGEKGLWLADLEKGTVVRYTRRLSGDLAKAEAWRAKGVRVEKDVDFAVALTSASVAASGLLEG